MPAASRSRTAPQPEAPQPEADGRRRRSQTSRARIVEAMLELVHAGNPAPSAEAVAARAEVGLRTVFRHFADMESLYREMSARIEAELTAMIEKPFEGATWRDRVVELVRRRAAVYERIAPFKRASEVHLHQSPFLQADHARMADGARRILRDQLPAAVARDVGTFETLDLLLSFEAWNRLRTDQGLNERRARALLEAAVRRCLGEGAASNA